MITTNKIPLGQLESEVSQTITNGVINKAPSEDAVFDGLAPKLIGVGYFDMTSFNPLDATTYYSNPINNMTWASSPSGRHGSCDVNSNNHRHKVIFWNNGAVGSAQAGTLTIHNLTQSTSEVLSTGVFLNQANNTYSFTSTLDFNAGNLYYFTFETPTYSVNPTTIFSQIISQFLV
jgi:hypothetical protein